MGKRKGKEQELPPKDEFDPLELVSKKPETVVLMLDSQEETVLQNACEALYKFAAKCDENKQQLLNLAALDRLLKLLSHEEKLVKRNAVMAVGTLATYANVRKVLRKADCLPSLLALLGPEEDILCHEFSSLAIASLAEEYASKVDIFEHGGLEPLIRLISSPDCDVQKNCVHAINLLFQDYHSRAAFHELEGIDPLLKLADSEYPVIQELALTALAKCTLDADNRVAFTELSGLDKMVEMVGKKELDDLHVLCLQVLANCLMDTENLQTIQSSGVFDKLLAFIAESANPDVQRYAAVVIAACCKSAENRKLFHERETEKTLITLLSGDHVDVSMAASKAIAVMSENLSSRELIGKLDGIAPLLALLKHDCPDLKEAATLALANLSSGNMNNCTEIFDKGGVDQFIRLLADGKPAVQGNVSVCLTNLAQDVSCRVDMLKNGVIPGLITAMQSNDTDVQSKSCQALSSLICDADARNEVLVENGLTHLVNLLKSNHETVRRSAAWTLTMCCVDQAISVEVTKLGGLAILQELNMSQSRRSSFTKAALDRVLDGNLSAKYSLTGALKPDNITTDGFYDVGRVSEGIEFPSLYTLCTDPVDKKRAIILINAVTPKQTKNKGPNVTIGTTDPSGVTLNMSFSRAGSKIKAESKSKAAKQREEKAANEELASNVDGSPPSDKASRKKKGPLQWQPPADPMLVSYVEECKKATSSLLTIREQIEVLAKYVCDKMGGPVPKDEIATFSFELPISQLKYDLNSNVIPIGKINAGIYYHRALLFKALSDRVGISCSLVRGDYGRGWNEVRLRDSVEANEPKMHPKTYLVDLMHNPGDCLLAGMPEAVVYQRI